MCVFGEEVKAGGAMILVVGLSLGLSSALQWCNCITHWGHDMSCFLGCLSVEAEIWWLGVNFKLPTGVGMGGAHLRRAGTKLHRG